MKHNHTGKLPGRDVVETGEKGFLRDESSALDLYQSDETQRDEITEFRGFKDAYKCTRSHFTQNRVK